MREIFSRFDVFIKLFLFAGLVAIGIYTWSISNKRSSQITKIVSQTLPQEIQETIKETKIIEECGEKCEQKIVDSVNRAIATVAAKINSIDKPVAITKPTSSVAKSTTKQVNYVSIDSSGITQKTDWDDLKNTDFYFNISDYGNVASAVWSANLKLQHGNGEGYARLYDATNSVAVPGSEISTKNPNFTLLESGNLSFLPGKNRYRVQLKSLSSFEVSYDSGKIKIVSE